MISRTLESFKIGALLVATAMVAGCGDAGVTTSVPGSCSHTGEYFCLSRDGDDVLSFEDTIYGRKIVSGPIEIGAWYDSSQDIVFFVDTEGTTGTFTSGISAAYTDDTATTYEFVSGYSSATVIISAYGDVGGYITGTFDLTLCAAGIPACGDETTLVGAFSVIREADV